MFGPLPQQRVATFTSVALHVKSDCVIRLKRNSYSVHSKYVGLRMEARIHQDQVELWYAGERVEVMPRLYGQGKEAIDFRHVIDSLVRKPGAFANYKYQHHMYPTTRFRMAYETLLKSTTETSAVKQYLKILHAAKHDGLETVDEILRWLLLEGKPLTAQEVLGMIASQQRLPGPTDLHVEPPDLSVFDSLLQHKDVYDDQENRLPPNDFTEFGDAQAGGLEVQLASYDEHLSLAGPTEGTASTDDPRAALDGSRACGAGEVDAPAVLVGPRDAGMRVTPSEPDREADEELAVATGQDVGSIPAGRADRRR